MARLHASKIIGTGVVTACWSTGISTRGKNTVAARRVWISRSQQLSVVYLPPAARVCLTTKEKSEKRYLPFLSAPCTVHSFCAVRALCLLLTVYTLALYSLLSCLARNRGRSRESIIVPCHWRTLNDRVRCPGQLGGEAR